MRYKFPALIVNDIRNFVFGIAGAAVYGSCKRRKQKFVMSFTITARESNVLSVFISHPRSLIFREQLIYKVWGTDTDIAPGNVDNYISFLRKRLREIRSVCEIKTVYGSGYKLED